MLQNLKKKKLLEQLGVNKTQNTSAVNDIDQNKDIVKHSTDFPGSKHKDIGKNSPPTMSTVPLKKQIKSGMENESKEPIEEQKKELTLGEEPEDKKKKMLSSLFRKK